MHTLIFLLLFKVDLPEGVVDAKDGTGWKLIEVNGHFASKVFF